jgi:hypothetical protein
MTTTFTLSDFKVGDTVEAFHPAMFGVVCFGTVTIVGRKWLTIDFGTIRGGTFRVLPGDVVQTWGEG